MHMHFSKQAAKHLREVFFGGNWTSVNVRDTLQAVTWEHSIRTVYSLNSISKLTYHIGYYVTAILKVMKGGPLDAHDKFSFDLPPLQDEEDWQKLVHKTLTEAEELIQLIERLPEDKLADFFVEEKYGTYYRNFHGLVEHTHYHLGQISLLKKILL
jgi:hypothetical protein